MVGLDDAGKTSILYRLKLGEHGTKSSPTIGFNVETITYRGHECTVWDVAGQEKHRALWRHYYQNTGGVVFVVDASAPSRVATARDELHQMLRDEQLRNAILLVYANKQDQPGALSARQLAEELGLAALSPTRPWHCLSVPCSRSATQLGSLLHES